MFISLFNTLENCLFVCSFIFFFSLVCSLRCIVGWSVLCVFFWISIGIFLSLLFHFFYSFSMQKLLCQNSPTMKWDSQFASIFFLFVYCSFNRFNSPLWTSFFLLFSPSFVANYCVVAFIFNAACQMQMNLESPLDVCLLSSYSTT